MHARTHTVAESGLCCTPKLLLTNAADCARPSRNVLHQGPVSERSSPRSRERCKELSGMGLKWRIWNFHLKSSSDLRPIALSSPPSFLMYARPRRDSGAAMSASRPARNSYTYLPLPTYIRHAASSKQVQTMHAQTASVHPHLQKLCALPLPPNRRFRPGANAIRDHDRSRLRGPLHTMGQRQCTQYLSAALHVTYIYLHEVGVV